MIVMQRHRLFALPLFLILSVVHPAQLLSQDDAAQQMYKGDPLCKSRRGAYPHPVYQPDPDYDEKARKKKIQGTVTLSVIVTKEGSTADIKVVKTLTPGLDQQAIKAVSRWRFEPLMQDGQVCATHINVEVQFKLY